MGMSMMDSSHAASSSGGALTRKRKIESSGSGDRLSKLTDHALGHVLSFLSEEEAAGAAMLSSRWRHVFTAVHNVSLVEPESPIPDYDDRVCHTPEYQCCPDPNAPLPFYKHRERRDHRPPTTMRRSTPASPSRRRGKL